MGNLSVNRLTDNLIVAFHPSPSTLDGGTLITSFGTAPPGWRPASAQLLARCWLCSPRERLPPRTWSAASLQPCLVVALPEGRRRPMRLSPAFTALEQATCGADQTCLWLCKPVRLIERVHSGCRVEASSARSATLVIASLEQDAAGMDYADAASKPRSSRRCGKISPFSRRVRGDQFARGRWRRFAHADAVGCADNRALPPKGGGW
jgi:hypothetical protein